MLVLSRKKDEAIIIGDGIKIKVLDCNSDQVKLGIEAPKALNIYREELYQAILAENMQAATPKEVDFQALSALLPSQDQARKEKE